MYTQPSIFQFEQEIWQSLHLQAVLIRGFLEIQNWFQTIRIVASRDLKLDQSQNIVNFH